MESAPHLPISSTDGDSLQWLWAHSTGIRTVLRFDDYLLRQDLPGLAEYLKSFHGPSLKLPEGKEPDASEQPKPGLFFGRPDGIGSHELRSTSPVQAANEFIKEVLNANLPPATKVVYENGYGELQEDFLFAAPIAAAYWQLSQIVTRAQPLRRCKECSHFFVVTHGRMLFCPAPPYLKGKTGSICGARYRQREWRSPRPQKSEED